MQQEYSKSVLDANTSIPLSLLKEEVSEALNSYRLFIAISFLAAIVGLYFFARVALEESDNQLDNYALIARAVIFVLAKAVLFHYLNKKTQQEIKILFLCGVMTSMSLLGFEIWSITISARDFIEKPVASYEAKNVALRNCDSKIAILKNKINGLQKRGFEKVNSKYKHFRESGSDLIAQSSKKETELNNEITRCDSIRIHNAPPRFALWGDAAKLFYAWGMSIIIVIVSDLFAAMAGHEKKALKRLLRISDGVGFDPVLPDGSNPKGNRPSLEKKESKPGQSLQTQAPSFVSPVSAVLNEDLPFSESPAKVSQETKFIIDKITQRSPANSSHEGQHDTPIGPELSGEQVSQKRAVKKRFVPSEKWRETPASGEEYQRVVKALMEDGVKCAVAPVKDAARLGHGKAKWCLETMAERGILVKKGDSYDHVQGKKVRKKRVRRSIKPDLKLINVGA